MKRKTLVPFMLCCLFSLPLANCGSPEIPQISTDDPKTPSDEAFGANSPGSPTNSQAPSQDPKYHPPLQEQIDAAFIELTSGIMEAYFMLDRPDLCAGIKKGITELKPSYACASSGSFEFKVPIESAQCHPMGLETHGIVADASVVFNACDDGESLKNGTASGTIEIPPGHDGFNDAEDYHYSYQISLSSDGVDVSGFKFSFTDLKLEKINFIKRDPVSHRPYLGSTLTCTVGAIQVNGRACILDADCGGCQLP